MFSLVIMPIYKGLTSEDQKYFRESREAGLGQTLQKVSSAAKSTAIDDIRSSCMTAANPSRLHDTNICGSLTPLSKHGRVALCVDYCVH